MEASSGARQPVLGSGGAMRMEQAVALTLRRSGTSKNGLVEADIMQLGDREGHGRRPAGAGSIGAARRNEDSE